MMDSDDYINLDLCFKNKDNTFAVLNKEQFDKAISKYQEKNIKYVKCYLNEFEICTDEYLLPIRLFFNGNTHWFYDYYIFYKAKKMFKLLYPNKSAMNKLGFYYCKERHAPLIIVNNTDDIEIALILAPQA